MTAGGSPPVIGWRTVIDPSGLNFKKYYPDDVLLMNNGCAVVAHDAMVHSPVTATLIEKHYRQRPTLLPFAQYNSLDLSNAQPNVSSKLRQELGWSDKDIVICTFGYVSDDKAPDELVWATKLLNDWGISTRLQFCGLPHGPVGLRLENLIEELKLGGRVFLETKFISPERYKKYMFAADVGVQMRTYFMGGLSGALNDCIAAALPSIANDHLESLFIGVPLIVAASLPALRGLPGAGQVRLDHVSVESVVAAFIAISDNAFADRM